MEQRIRYEQDIVAWANQQAAFIRAGRFDLLDLEHIADEIEDVGKSERRELISRMAELLAHLLKWHFSRSGVVPAGKPASGSSARALPVRLLKPPV